MPPKKPVEKPVTNSGTRIEHSNFTVASPPTNEHDVASVVAMSGAIKEIAIAMQEIAAAASRSTVMNGPMISIGEK